MKNSRRFPFTSVFLRGIIKVLFSSTWEIPQYRLPQHVVDFEANLVRDLGVQVEFERSLSTADITVKRLVDEFDAAFIAIGLPTPKAKKLS